MSKLALAALLCGLPLGASATSREVEDLLTKMREAYAKVSTATFALEATLKTEDGILPIVLDGRFQAPNLLRATVTVMGQQTTIVCDGKEVQVTAPGLGSRKRPYSLDTMGTALPANLEVLCLFDWKRQLSTARGDNMHGSELVIRRNVEWDARRWLVLQESAPQVGVFVEYYVDPQTYMIRRTVVQDLKSRQEIGDYRLRRIDLGSRVQASDFRIDG